MYRHFAHTTPLSGMTGQGDIAREGAPLSVELVTGPAAIESTAPTWLELEEAAAHCTPFQTWHWAQAWARTLKPTSVEPLIFLVRDEHGRPLALMPLQRDRHVGLRRITWFSTPTLQYGGLLMRPMPEREARAVLTMLRDVLTSERADYVDLLLVTTDNPAMEMIPEADRTTPHNHAWRIDFTGHEDWRAFELALKPSARRARKKRLNRLKRAGNLQFLMHEAPAVPEGLLEQALAWKRGWLQAQGLDDSEPMQPAYGAFLQALGARPERHGRGRWLVAELRLDDVPLAVDVGMAMDGVFYSFFAAYNADYAEHSPGKAALWLTMQWCMENGLFAYDMLANPAPYKMDWANAKAPLWRSVQPLGVGGVAYRLWARQVSSLAREVQHALPAPLKSLLRKALTPLRSR